MTLALTLLFTLNLYRQLTGVQWLHNQRAAALALPKMRA